MALNFLQNLFGGTNQQSQSTSNSVDMQSDAAKGLRQPLSNALLGLLDQGGPSYQGAFNAPIGQNETTQLGNLMGNNGPGTARSGLLDKTLNGDFLPGGQNENPFLKAAITAAQRPTMENLTETLSRALPGRFTQAGQMVQPQGSSAFDRAAALATRGASQSMADIATNMSAGAYNTERGLQQQAVPMSQQEVQTGIQNLQAQSLPRMIQELGIERGLAEFQRRTSSLLQLLQTIGGVAAPSLGTNAQSTSEANSTQGVLSKIGFSAGPFSIGGK